MSKSRMIGLSLVIAALVSAVSGVLSAQRDQAVFAQMCSTTVLATIQDGSCSTWYYDVVATVTECPSDSPLDVEAELFDDNMNSLGGVSMSPGSIPGQWVATFECVASADDATFVLFVPVEGKLVSGSAYETNCGCGP